MKKQNIFLVGSAGAGKSSVGQALAKRLNMDFYDADRVLESRMGASISWIFDVEGEEAVRKREIKILEELVDLPNAIIATGGDAILEPDNRKNLKGKGLIVYLATTIEAQLNRTRQKEHRPLLQVDDVEETLKAMQNERESLYDDIADVRFDTQEKSVKAITAAICEYLNHDD